MDHHGFQNYLYNIKHNSQADTDVILHIAETIENSLQQDLDDIISDDLKMKKSLQAIKKQALDKSKEEILKSYYAYKNGHPYAAPKKSSSTCSPSINNKKAPNCISGFCNNTSRFVEYAPGEGTLEGLVGFLDEIYDAIIEFSHMFFGGQACTDFAPIPVLLKKFPEIKKQFPKNTNNLDKWKLDRIANLVNNGQPADNDAIRFILDAKPYKFYPLGLYYSDGSITFHGKPYRGPYIELFYMMPDTVNEKEYKAIMANCLAHEYFHHIHDMAAIRTYRDSSFDADCVREALAEFFAFMFCLGPHFIIDIQEAANLTKRKHDKWKNEYGGVNPYAYAYYFFLINGRVLPYTDVRYDYDSFGSIGKFMETLYISKCDMSDAYRYLTR